MYADAPVSDDGRWSPSTTRAVEVAHDHVVGRQLVVGDTGRLDHEQVGAGHACRDVAGRPHDEAVADELGVQGGDLVAQPGDVGGDVGVERHDAPPVDDLAADPLEPRASRRCRRGRSGRAASCTRRTARRSGRRWRRSACTPPAPTCPSPPTPPGRPDRRRRRRRRGSPNRAPGPAPSRSATAAGAARRRRSASASRFLASPPATMNSSTGTPAPTNASTIVRAPNAVDSIRAR